ncbi:hypothetical protein HNR46_000101 [Haloferula luteola]|uniref:Uncharacterized protein n=1 Tax=Haloferula luteola TaxID=595692 RepID=A0A840V7E7_9BACT|nr:hypothetical protein [Haloferula luteola]MBB5349880.1 hypothetical protein [Haloferula luteola]
MNLVDRIQAALANIYTDASAIELKAVVENEHYLWADYTVVDACRAFPVRAFGAVKVLKSIEQGHLFEAQGEVHHFQL